MQFERVMRNTPMHGFLSDITGGLVSDNPLDTLTNLIGGLDPTTQLKYLLNSIEYVNKSISQQLSYIDWGQIGRNLGDAASVIANVLIQIDPEHASYMLFTTTDIGGISTGHTFNEFNKVTGGLFTSVDNVWTLPSRVVRGDPISKAELVDDAMLLLKVAVIVMTFGTAGAAGAMIGVGAGQLKKGTLGQTESGRTLLEIAEVAGYAFAAEQSIGDAVLNKSEDIALARGQTYTIKQTGLEGSELGQIAVGAGFVAGGGAVKGTDISAGLTSYGQQSAITEAGRGTPGGDILAKMYFQYGISKPDVGTGDSQSSGFWDNFEMPDFASIPGRIADALSNIKITAPSLGPISIPSIDISAPSMPEINVGQIPDIPWPFPGGPKRKVISKRKVAGGYQYCDESGACQTVEETTNIWPFVLLAVVGVVYYSRERHA